MEAKVSTTKCSGCPGELDKGPLHGALPVHSRAELVWRSPASNDHQRRTCQNTASMRPLTSSGLEITRVYGFHKASTSAINDRTRSDSFVWASCNRRSIKPKQMLNSDIENVHTDWVFRVKLTGRENNQSLKDSENFDPRWNFICIKLLEQRF
jgi:hypothetical protein